MPKNRLDFVRAWAHDAAWLSQRLQCVVNLPTCSSQGTQSVPGAFAHILDHGIVAVEISSVVSTNLDPNCWAHTITAVCNRERGSDRHVGKCRTCPRDVWLVGDRVPYAVGRSGTMRVPRLSARPSMRCLWPAGCCR